MKTNTNRIIKKKRRGSLIILILLSVLFAGQAGAQVQEEEVTKEAKESVDRWRTAIGMCPGGIAFGIYSANIEHLFGEHHGLVLRGDYEVIPKTYSDAHIDASGKALILNYRYHLAVGLNTCYVGAFARYRKYKGDGILETGAFDFKIPEYTLGLNVGRRWIWKSGFTMNFALGYGYAYDELKTSNSSQAALEAIDVFREEYDFLSGFLGEFSIGYAF